MTTTTSEPQRSGPGVEQVGKRVKLWFRSARKAYDIQWRTVIDKFNRWGDRETVNEDGSDGGALSKAAWRDGDYILDSSPAPAKQPAPVDVCKGAPCGMTMKAASRYADDHRDNWTWNKDARRSTAITSDDGTIFYCSPACRDAAMPKARCTDVECGTLKGSLPYYCSERCLREVEGASAKPSTRVLVGKPAPQPAPWHCADCGHDDRPRADGYRDTCVVCVEASRQPAPWKCLNKNDCATPTAPEQTRGVGAGYCVVCADTMIGQMMIRHDTHRTVEAPVLPTSPMLPGSAHALAVAGAMTWRRPTSYVPLDDPNGDDLP